MQWLRKQSDAVDRPQQQQDFIIGSDRWMASHRSAAECSDQVKMSPIEGNPADLRQQNPSVGTSDAGLRSNSSHTQTFPHQLSSLKLPSESKLYPDLHQSTTEPGNRSIQQRSGSLYPNLFTETPGYGSGSGSLEKEKQIYPDIYQYTDPAVVAEPEEGEGIYPKIYSGSVTEGGTVRSVGDRGLEKQAMEEVEASEEVLVKIPEVMVHLIDQQGSALLASGEFSLFRVLQNGNAIAVFARVGDDFQWPIAKDESATKLDSAHYFFSIRAVDEEEDEPTSPELQSSSSCAKSGRAPPPNPPAEVLNYGVTFPVQGNEQALKELDRLLEQYCLFSMPTVLQGDAKDGNLGLVSGTKAGVDRKDKEVGKIVAPADPAKVSGKVVPKEVLGGKQGKKPSNESSNAFWTTMAPNVEDYNSSLAKAIAAGTGQIIKSIFWCSDSTVASIQKGGAFVKGHLKPGSPQAPANPRVLKNIRRARKISKMSQKTADAILSGVVKTVGFFSMSLVNSKGGKKFFSLLPGEVALASLDAFGKIFDAVEVAGKNVLSATSLETSGVVSHSYGAEAGEMTHESLKTVGYAIGTVWTISKIRKALNPKNTAKPSSVMKTAAKAVYAEIKK